MCFESLIVITGLLEQLCLAETALGGLVTVASLCMMQLG